MGRVTLLLAGTGLLAAALAGQGPVEQERGAGQAPAGSRATTRTVVVGVDGRVLELRSDGSSVHRDPEGAQRDRGDVLLERMAFEHLGLESLGLGRGFLGVQLIGLTEQLRARFGVPAGEGALVSEVVAGSPAERAGVRAGDVITAVESQPVRRTGDVSRLVASREGELAELEVYRRGVLTRLTVTVAERQRPLLKVARDGGTVVLQWIGGESPARFDAEGGRFLFEDALAGLGLYFESDEWRERAEGTPEDLDAAALEMRIEAVKKQLSELREQLERIDPDPGS
jgi:hypothetical protein